uniref:Dendritic cell-specific transmembrane protein-like domain-containing protein n=1 Tax=Eptatretus burgeri TaxID=7764 RepID=A0A8C4QGJ3_EPTBU
MKKNQLSLPLLYLGAVSPFLTPLEKRRLLLRMLYWLAFFLFTIFIIMIDYSTYWMLAKMQHFLQGDIVAQTPTQIAIKVHGTGVISDIYREMVKSYDTLQKTRFTIISIKCSPIPSPVDLNSYYIIGLIYGIALFMNIFEAYGLRFRRAICAKYYPEREQHRIMFLYNEILTQRHGVLKQMWRTIRRKGKYGGHTNFLQILATRIRFLRPLVAFMGTTTQYCLACGASATRANINTFQNCIKPGCKGFYCSDCFGKLGSKCTLCLNPLDYGDESGFSEVVDSSDEELCRRVKVDTKNMDHQSGRPSSESESYDLSESEVKFAYQKTSHYSKEVRNHDACPLQPSKHKYEDLLKESDIVSGPSGPESDLEVTDNEDEKTESEESEEDEEDGKVKSVEMES